jgi:Raf kinase inhibitor-like YbhB/YbcL family protein
MAPLFDKLAIASPTITPLRPIPDEHVAGGGNAAPTITISGVPEGTVELAVICHDPDAPLAQGFTHWVVYGLPSSTTVVDLSVAGVRTAANGTGSSGWFGPQPPEGHGQHHYYFWVYALNRRVAGEPTREAFLGEYADAIIEQARLVGTYER